MIFIVECELLPERVEKLLGQRLLDHNIARQAYLASDFLAEILVLERVETDIKRREFSRTRGGRFDGDLEKLSGGRVVCAHAHLGRVGEHELHAVVVAHVQRVEAHFHEPTVGQVDSIEK